MNLSLTVIVESIQRKNRYLVSDIYSVVTSLFECVFDRFLLGLSEILDISWQEFEPQIVDIVVVEVFVLIWDWVVMIFGIVVAKCWNNQSVWEVICEELIHSGKGIQE